MKPLAKIIVRETAGIRRFLYPLGKGLYADKDLRTPLPVKIEPPAPGTSWSVCENDGTLVPSCAVRLLPEALLADEGFSATDVLGVAFAISLAPYEERELLIVESARVSTVPDAMRLTFSESSGLTSEQERVRFHICGETGLDSVVYDGIEHLAGTLAITVDGSPIETAKTTYGPNQDNLGLLTGVWLCDKLNTTFYEFTACKSWVTVKHTTNESTAGKSFIFSLPLRAFDEIPTCDFGVGNGVYEKITGDAVMWTTEFGEKPYARWRVSTVNAGEERIDYQGQYETAEEFAGRAWFHWIEKTKALAVAIPGIHHYCDRITVTLARNGKIDIAFTMSRNAPAGAHFSVCYHFLNDIPAIAAATNPASILLPPTVEIRPLD